MLVHLVVSKGNEGQPTSNVITRVAIGYEKIERMRSRATTSFMRTTDEGRYNQPEINGKSYPRHDDIF